MKYLLDLCLILQEAAGRFDKHEAIAAKSYFVGNAHYEEHPMLIDRACYSFNFPKNVRDFRHKEDDRDTGIGRCKVRIGR